MPLSLMEPGGEASGEGPAGVGDVGGSIDVDEIVTWHAPSRRLIATAATAVLAIGIGFVVANSSTSRERFHAALAPTDLVPGARGQATLTKTASGWRIG